jgi:hypothetical protein
VDQKRWFEVCEAASVEQDPQRLLEQSRDILEMLNRQYDSLRKMEMQVALQRKPS